MFKILISRCQGDSVFVTHRDRGSDFRQYPPGHTIWIRYGVDLIPLAASSLTHLHSVARIFPFLPHTWPRSAIFLGDILDKRTIFLKDVTFRSLFWRRVWCEPPSLRSTIQTIMITVEYVICPFSIVGWLSYHVRYAGAKLCVAKPS